MRPSIPTAPLALGLGGLIPFWGLALARLFGLGGDPVFVGLVLAAYAATILSFLGGIRWGLAVKAEGREGATPDFVVSVLPQLLGWGCLALPDPYRLLLLGVLLLVLGPADLRLVGRGLAPAWFGRLRMILSVGAGVAVLLGALA